MMIQVFEFVVIIPSTAVFLLALFLCAEVLAALFPRHSYLDGNVTLGQIAVVIPAHNEAGSILPTLQSIKAQARPEDRVIVIADNCTDETAEVAYAAGVLCWERNDPKLRGKGYALQFALDCLKEDAPQIVIFIDADCMIGEDALVRLATLAVQKQRPVQALYLMNAPEGAGARLRVSAFAWAFINRVRMSGLDRLFGVSRFTGAGMAMPWALAEQLQVGSGEIVEDLSLTLDLTQMRAAPLLLLDVEVTSEFPTADDALAKQRARWEHGSQRLAATRALPSFLKGLVSGNFQLCALSIDLLIPPMMNFVGLIGLVVMAGLVLAIFGTPVPLFIALTALVLVSGSIIVAWAKFGHDILPMSDLRGLLPFLAAKRGIYNAKGRQSAQSWTATRSGEHDESAGE